MTLAERVESPSELAEVANREYGLAVGAARTALEHALACGEALLAARALIPEGEWMAWIDENFAGARSTAQKMMRLAMYRDQLPEDATVDGAHALLSGLQRTNGYVVECDETTKRAAVRLYRRGGRTMEQVGAEFGVCGSTIHNWVTRDARLKRDQEARAALERQQRDRAMKKIGGSVAEGYSLIRKTAQMLDRAAGEARDRDVRAAINSALAKLHAAEDEIVKAVGLS